MAKKKEKKKTNLEKALRDESFKIKPILLELPNYGYYHTAVDGNDADLNKRFIGRKKIINKIRSFIFETTSDTGAYLVTGFRGMGKTSVINEALSILNPKLNWLNHIALIFTLFPLLLFRNEAILNWTFVVYAWAFVGVVWFLYFFVYARHSQNKARKGKNVFFDMFRWMFDRVHYTVQSKSEKNYYEPYRLIRIVNLYSFLAALTVTTWFFLNFTDKTDQLWSIPLFYITIARFLFLKERYSKHFQRIKKGHDLNFGLIGKFNSRYRKYVFLSIHLLLGAVLTLPVFFIFCQKDIEIHFGFYLLFGFVAWNLFISVVDRYFAQNLSNKDSLYQSQLFGLRSFLNFQHYHQVHINLGKDDLTEKDVLKFITSEFYQVYKKWYSDYINVKRILNVGFIYFFVFIIINATFYMLPKQVLQDEINNTFGLSDFFPSQELTTVGSGGYIHMDSIEDLDHYFQTLTVFSHIDVLADSLKKIVGKPNSITHEKLAQILSNSKNWEMTEAKPTNITNAIFQKEVNNQMEGYTFHFTEAGIQDLPNPLDNTKDTTRTHTTRTHIQLYRNFSIDLKKYGYANLNPEKLVIQKVNIKGAKGENDTTFVNSSSMFESFKYSVARYANGLDFIILYYYTSLRKTILPEHILEESNASLIGKMNNDETENHHFLHSLLLYVFPPTPNYLVFFFFFTLLFVLYLIPSNWLPFTLHRHNLKRLKKLKEEIAATTSEERNGGGLKTQYSWFNTKRSFNKEPLDTKEITQELIHILEETSKVPSVFVKTKVIFVLDELDKIEINYNSTLSSKEEEQSPKPKNQGYHTYRRERIASILSSMKHFLNSAKAKFIFIAGREMYDAALAGISDRESSLDSIFNDNKIYVGSFYIEGEDDRWADITGTTENYVCRFLFPKKYTERTDFDQYNLKTYATYLKGLDKYSNSEIVKIITTLKDFIVYLTYRSNGAPRKLSNIFEQHVQNLTDAEFNDDGILRVGPNNNSMYLRFSYYAQYKASLISYLVSPVFLQLGNFMHEYSDKLLVSISYMLDHLFKHHKAGLSYRSLSLAPEIVDVNKEPEFRNFLERLIENMSTNHLGVIVSGIYDFKFNSKIASEFKLLSKINEQETAAFNFTQDETIEIKKHFHSRLQAIKSDQRNSQQNGDPFHDYTNSESFLKMLLGDLYFQDEQYFDATNYYMDAIQILRLQELDKMNIYNFILLIRNKLKLALAFKKNKIYDNALMTYAEISNSILQKAAIEKESIGQANWQNKKVFQNYFFSSIENIRILYQPIVAKLHLIQKSTPNKLSKGDILRAMEEFEFLKKKSLGDPKLIIESEFYNKIGDLLFYRNGTLLVSAPDDYRVDTPIDAALFYIQSLCVILRMDLQNILAWYKNSEVGKTEINEQDKLLWSAVKNILSKKESLLIKHNYDELITISNSLVDLASCLISLLPNEEDQTKIASKQNDILKLFFLSARIFEQIGKPTLAKSQYLKVLHLARVFKVERQKLNQIIQNNGSKEYSNEITEVEKDQLEKFMDHLKVLCHQAYSAASRIESAKMEEIFAGTVNSKDHVQSSLVIENDIQEVEMLRLFYDLKVNKDDEDSVKKALKYVYDNIHSHALVRKKFNRIIQLELRLECNRLWFEYIKDGKPNPPFYDINQENKLTDIERNKFLVIDSIGCCHELMKLHELIGVNYVSTSNMTFRSLAKKFVQWIDLLEDMKATMVEQKKDDINRLLKSILNSETLMYINKEYYQDMQKQYELKVENFHTQGSPLREFVKNESYLDDFYNDKIIHFSIAMERFQWLRNRKSSTNNLTS